MPNNKLQIQLNLSREINTSQLLNSNFQDTNTIFGKGTKADETGKKSQFKKGLGEDKDDGVTTYKNINNLESA